jgi:hypothetical protein
MKSSPMTVGKAASRHQHHHAAHAEKKTPTNPDIMSRSRKISI